MGLPKLRLHALFMRFVQATALKVPISLSSGERLTYKLRNVAYIKCSDCDESCLATTLGVKYAVGIFCSSTVQTYLPSLLLPQRDLVKPVSELDRPEVAVKVRERWRLASARLTNEVIPHAQSEFLGQRT